MLLETPLPVNRDWSSPWMKPLRNFSGASIPAVQRSCTVAQSMTRSSAAASPELMALVISPATARHSSSVGGFSTDSTAGIGPATGGGGLGATAQAQQRAQDEDDRGLRATRCHRHGPFHEALATPGPTRREETPEISEHQGNRVSTGLPGLRIERRGHSKISGLAMRPPPRPSSTKGPNDRHILSIRREVLSVSGRALPPSSAEVASHVPSIAGSSAGGPASRASKGDARRAPRESRTRRFTRVLRKGEGSREAHRQLESRPRCRTMPSVKSGPFSKECV